MTELGRHVEGQVDGLPQHWFATVRRNWWGTVNVKGFYNGPELQRPVMVVSGWCWTRRQSATQVRYWIEETIEVGTTDGLATVHLGGFTMPASRGTAGAEAVTVGKTDRWVEA